MRDPVECCQLAGVQAPSSVLQHAGSIESSISTDTTGEVNEVMVSLKIEKIRKLILKIKVCSWFVSFCSSCQW